MEQRVWSFVFAPDCDGSDDCPAGLHVHGCLCDTEGFCDDRLAHAGGAAQ